MATVAILLPGQPSPPAIPVAMVTPCDATVPLRSDNKVTVHFVNRDGEKITAKGSPGDSLLDLVINEDLDFDGFGTHAHTHTRTHTRGHTHTHVRTHTHTHTRTHTIIIVIFSLNFCFSLVCWC